MDQANTLVRTVVRSFHSSPTAHQILIVDALITHSVLSHDDLTSLLGPQRKELNRILQPLRTARLIASHTRQESRDGYSKAVPRDYFFINYHTAIDTIKYRVWQLQNEVKKQYDVDEKTKAERPFWVCRRCGKDWTEMGVLHLATPWGGFECDRCEGPIEQANEGKAADDPALMAGHEKLARLNAQLDKITKLLRRIDSLEVPENSFDAAWERRKEIPGGSKNYTPARISASVGAGLKTAKAGTGQPEQTDAKNLAISLTTSEELSTAEQAEKDRRKEELARQNAKPIWITQSTVAAAAANANGNTTSTTATTTNGSTIKNEPGNTAEDEKPDTEEPMDADMQKYWLDMQREKEEADRKADEEEYEDEDEEDDDEDEDDFEDVPPSSVPAAPVATPSPRKREREEDDDAEGSSEGRKTNGNGVSKKIKSERNGDGGGGDGKVAMRSGEGDANGVKAEKDKDDDGSSDEDAFEDVM
ncbi:MAG: hypothetical protein Q9160_002058 [Pyrenula sp. 1 TL-2023]